MTFSYTVCRRWSCLIVAATVCFIAQAEDPTALPAKKPEPQKAPAPKKKDASKQLTPAELEDLMKTMDVLKKLDLLRYVDLLNDLDAVGKLSGVAVTPKPPRADVIKSEAKK